MPPNLGTAGPGITLLRELVLGRSQTPFAKVVRRFARASCRSSFRRVEEVANNRNGFLVSTVIIRKKVFGVGAPVKVCNFSNVACRGWFGMLPSIEVFCGCKTGGLPHKGRLLFWSSTILPYYSPTLDQGCNMRSMADQYLGNLMGGLLHTVEKIVPQPDKRVGGFAITIGDTIFSIGPEVDLDGLRQVLLNNEKETVFLSPLKAALVDLIDQVKSANPDPPRIDAALADIMRLWPTGAGATSIGPAQD
jgi:hypothetical protein